MRVSKTRGDTCPASISTRRSVLMQISRGFRGRRRADIDPARPARAIRHCGLPLSSRPGRRRTRLAAWTFEIRGAVDTPLSWSWEEFTALPSETPTVDIHCVTKWSKLDTPWRGVSLDTPSTASTPPPVTSSPSATAATRRTCRSRPDGAGLIAYEYEGAPPPRSTAVLHVCSSPTCTSGRAQMGSRDRAAQRQRAGLLGDVRLPRLRRPVERAAYRGD